MNRHGSLMLAIAIAALPLPLAGCGTGSMLSKAGFSSVDPTFDAQYAQIDTNGDKKVSYADTRAWLARVLAESDANKDGKLQEAEIPAVLVPPKPDAKSFLLSYDRDGDGGLSEQELGVHVNVLFQRDTNSDGELSYEEVRYAPKGTPEGPATSTPKVVEGTNSTGGGFPGGK